MKRGEIVIARIRVGRVRVAEETIAPGESYARVIRANQLAVVVDVCGIALRLRPDSVRRAPKLVQP